MKFTHVYTQNSVVEQQTDGDNEVKRRMKELKPKERNKNEANKRKRLKVLKEDNERIKEVKL